ncbi:MAG: hypothetical protein SF187_02440 [Deltaproteobacteria bacterium]|nr:hypothetical protein [Deltaproteobacteria bacterium]
MVRANMGAAVMDTEDRTVIASVPFDDQDDQKLVGPPEDRTNPTADAQILESTTMDLPTRGSPAPHALVVAAPTGMAALAAAHKKPLFPPHLWPQLRAHANRRRTVTTWQLVSLVLASVAFGAWLSS